MHIKIHSFDKHKRLSVVQFASSEQNTIEYISGITAIAKKLISVSEISTMGSVNNIKLTNQSNFYIFFMDGDILIGAKQNRVLNTSVFVKPHSTINIPVSCVEQGRWSSSSSEFTQSKFIYPDIMRLKKIESVTLNLRRGHGHFANQNKVWDEVSFLASRFDSFSNTQNLEEILEKNQEKFDSYIDKIPLNKEANGIAIFSDNYPISIDIFNRVDIYQEYFSKKLINAAIESSNLKNGENNLTEAEAKFRLLDLFDQLEKQEFTIHDGVGIGQEKRYTSDDFVATELNYENHLVHFTFLKQTKKIDFRRF